MLSGCRAASLVRANWWDGSPLEHLVRPINDLPFRAEQLKCTPPTEPAYTMITAGCEPIQPLPYPTDRSPALGQVTATALAPGESKHEPLWAVRESLGQLHRFCCQNCEPPTGSSTSPNETRHQICRKLPQPMLFVIERPNAMLSGCRA
jgi:hypothetical protein